jgi:Ca2+-binding RTX toxin-like protein
VISAGESVGVSRDLTDDTLDGGDGNDTIDGSAGNNSIIGDEGDDSIRGGAGNDTILGGSGTDSLFGGEGDDVMSAGESLGVSGDQTDDTLDGGDGNDTIDGSAGDNAITGGAGNDILTGGKGSDRFNVDAGTDTIVDFSLSEDTINLSPGASVHIYTTLEDESFVNWKVTNTTGTERSFGVSGVYSLNTETKQTSYDASYAKYPVLINGSRVADTIIGGAVDDSIDGGIGHDKIDGGLGNDTIKGGSGNDSIRGGEGSDIIIGGTGADAIDLAETVSAKDVVIYTAKITAALKFEVADTIKRASSDTITGFVSGADKIQLSLDFGKANGPLVKAATGGYIANAALKAEDFVAATAAMTGTAADVAKGGRFYVTIETVGTTKNTVLNFDANGDSVKAANASEVTGTTTDDFVVLKLIGIPAATAAAAITPVLVPADIIFA